MDNLLSPIIEEVNKLVADLNVPENNIPWAGSPRNASGLYLTIRNHCFTLIAYDYRGGEEILLSTKDYDEIKFEILRKITFSFAIHYSVAHSLQEEDQRILAFKKQVEILETYPIKKEFLDKLKNKYEKLLKQKLFSDL